MAILDRVSYRIFCWGGGGGGEHLGDLLKHFDIGGGGRQACLTEIMTSEIQKVSAKKLVVNKFQLSVELLRL